MYSLLSEDGNIDSIQLVEDTTSVVPTAEHHTAQWQETAKSLSFLVLVELPLLPFTVMYSWYFTLKNSIAHFERFKCNNSYGHLGGIGAGLWFFALALPTAFFASAMPFIIHYDDINSIEDVITCYTSQKPRTLANNATNLFFMIYGIFIALAALNINIKFAKNQSIKAWKNFQQSWTLTTFSFIFPGIFSALPSFAAAFESLDALPVVGVGLGVIFGFCNLLVYGISRGIRVKELAVDIFNGNFKQKYDIIRYVYLLKSLSAAEKNQLESTLLLNQELFFYEEIGSPTGLRNILNQFEQQTILKQQESAFLKEYRAYFCLALLTSLSILVPFGHTAYKGLTHFDKSFGIPLHFSATAPITIQLAIGLIFSIWSGLFYFTALRNIMLDLTRCDHAEQVQPGYQPLSWREEIFSEKHSIKAISIVSCATVLNMAWRVYSTQFYDELSVLVFIPILLSAVGAGLINYVSSREEQASKAISAEQTHYKLFNPLPRDKNKIDSIIHLLLFKDSPLQDRSGWSTNNSHAENYVALEDMSSAPEDLPSHHLQ